MLYDPLLARKKSLYSLYVMVYHALMATTTITTVPISPATLKAAADVLAAYREAGYGSGRGVPTTHRTVTVIAACMTALATGKAVDLTALFPREGKSAPYYMLHRVLGTPMMRELGYWHACHPAGIKNAKWAGRKVTGETSTEGSTILLTLVK